MCRFCWHTLRRACYPSPYTLVLERVSGGTVACMRTVRAVMRWASRWTPRAVLDRAWGRWGPAATKSTSSLDNGAWMTPLEFLDGLARAGVDLAHPAADRSYEFEVRN